MCLHVGGDSGYGEEEFPLATLLLTIAWLCDLEGFCFCAPTRESGPVFNTVLNCSLITWHRSFWTLYTTVMSCKGVLLIFYCQNTPHKIFTNNMYLLKICITWCTALFYSKKKCITQLLCICDMHVCPWSHRRKIIIIRYICYVTLYHQPPLASANFLIQKHKTDV